MTGKRQRRLTMRFYKQKRWQYWNFNATLNWDTFTQRMNSRLQRLTKTIPLQSWHHRYNVTLFATNPISLGHFHKQHQQKHYRKKFQFMYLKQHFWHRINAGCFAVKCFVWKEKPSYGKSASPQVPRRLLYCQRNHWWPPIQAKTLTKWASIMGPLLRIMIEHPRQ